MSWGKVRLGDILTESKIICENPNPDRRIKVKLKVLGVEKRGVENEIIGATKQFIRKSGQFIYGKQNFHKGAFGIIPKELDGFESSADLPAFDVSKDCLPEWLFYFFKQGNFYLELSKIARGVATQRIHPKQICDLEIPLPDIKTQKEFLSKIYSVENKGVELTTALIHQLDLVKQLRQAFLREAMQGKLVPQDHNDEPAGELLSKIKAEKEQLIKEKKIKKQKPLLSINENEIPFEIPKYWVWCRLGELGICLTGTTPSTVNKEYFGNDIPFIKPADITLSGLILDNEGLSFAGLEQGVSVPKNSLLMVCIGGSIGKSYYNEVDVSCNQQINTINLLSAMQAKFLQNWLQSNYFQKAIWSKASGGTTPIVNRSKWESIIIPLPPLSEQQRIVSKLDKLMQYCDKLEQSIDQSLQQAESLRQSILKRAFEGKLVPHDPNDEPSKV